jgi:replicative DNA helicase
MASPTSPNGAKTPKIAQKSEIQMPYSQEAEDAVLSSIMIDPTSILEVDSILKSPMDFFLLSNRIIYTAMQRIKTREDEIDPITLADELSRNGELEKIGGHMRLMKLHEALGTSVHASVYAQLVARAALRRRMVEATDKMRHLAFDEKLNIDEVRGQADNAWLSVTSDIAQDSGAWMAEVVSEVYDDIERAMVNKRTIAGLTTGLRDVDLVTNGLGEGQLIIIAGRPAMGKSAAMDNIALANAKQGIPVFYATSERAKKEVVLRMAAIESGINSIKLSTGKISPQEAARFTDAIGRIAKLPIYFDDAPMPRPRDIYAQADWMIKRFGCKLVLFDGMYRAKTGDENTDKNEHKKYGTIALELKTMARALNVPVVTTHQLSRDVEKRQDKRPVMSDLRESGRIEEEADKILFLYRDEVYNEATQFPNACDWIMAKHRNGATGTVSTYYEKTITKFLDATVHHVDLGNLDAPYHD